MVGMESQVTIDDLPKFPLSWNFWYIPLECPLLNSQLPYWKGRYPEHFLQSVSHMRRFPHI